jgi:hypothetical protein
MKMDKAIEINEVHTNKQQPNGIFNRDKVIAIQIDILKKQQ